MKTLTYPAARLGRDVWLTELAAALDWAQDLLPELLAQGLCDVEVASVLRKRLNAARAEVRLLQLRRGDAMQERWQTTALWGDQPT